MATSNLDITKIASKLAAKKYAVVEFVENSKALVEIVCTKWIRCSNNKMEVYWPPGQFHKARQLCKKQVDPDLTTWSCYESTSLLKATNTFATASKALKKSQFFTDLSTADSSESDEASLQLLERKRKTRTPARYDDDVGDDNASSSKPKKKKKTSRIILPDSIPFPEASVEHAGPVNRIVEDSIADISIDDGRAASNSIAGSVNHSGPVNRIVEDSIADISIDDGRAASNSIAGSVNHSGPVNRIVEDSIADISIDDGRAASNSIAGSVNHSASRSEATSSNKPAWAISMEQDIHRMRIGMVEVRQEIRANRAILERMYQMMQNRSESEVIVEEPPEGLPSLPVNSLEEFKELEEFLAPSAVQKQMVQYLQRYQDNDVRIMIKSILDSIMTDRLMLEFNWMGQRGKTPIQSSIIIKVLFGAVQKNCKHATLKEKTVIAQNHLRYASKRLEGRKKKEG